MTAIDPVIGRPFGRIERTALVIAPLIALFDHWFWTNPGGASLTLACAVVCAVSIGLNTRFAMGRRALVACGLAVAAVLPLAETTSVLSVIVALTLTTLAVLTAAGRLSGRPWDALGALGGFFLTTFFRAPRDAWRWGRARRRVHTGGIRLGWLAAWLMPAALTVVFLTLFAEANPVIEQWLALLDPSRLLDRIAFNRVVFWVFLVLVVWPFLRPARGVLRKRIARIAADAAASIPTQAPRPLDSVFGPAAVLRALILFNALFAIQTALDLHLLWGGGALPQGMTYAEYAHRGAYPLIVTALLAAAFVLIALRAGSQAGENPLIRKLVYLWVAQNVALVVSSIYRLDLYVSIYALTYLRIAAFVWMGLVATGLGLIVARIALGKSGEWLVGANLAALSATLYVCCFVDFAALIGEANLKIASQPGATRVDATYLTRLDAYGAPYVDRLLASDIEFEPRYELWLRDWRENRARRHRKSLEDWRGWTRRGLALRSYLDQNPIPPYKAAEATP